MKCISIQGIELNNAPMCVCVHVWDVRACVRACVSIYMCEGIASKCCARVCVFMTHTHTRAHSGVLMGTCVFAIPCACAGHVAATV